MIRRQEITVRTWIDLTGSERFDVSGNGGRQSARVTQLTYDLVDGRFDRAEGLAFPVLKSGALGSMSRTVRFYRWHAEWSTVVKVLRGRGVVIVDGGVA